jgi:ribosomal protein S18 acetylase RimI-like enzyme
MLPTYTTRRVRPADLDRILEIEDACFGVDGYDRNLFAEYFNKSGDLFLLIERRKNICGYVLSCIRGRTVVPTAELVSLAVEPAARRKGAATVLLAGTLRRLRRRSIARLSLMVKVTNDPAIAFYNRHGFIRMRRVPRYYEDGADGFLMSREL